MKNMNTKQIAVDEQQNALAALYDAVSGRFSDIAKNANVTTATVSRVLRGQWENEKVIREAKKMRTKIERERKRYAKLIS